MLLAVFASLAATAYAVPNRRWYPEAIGAQYFHTNDFGDNQLVSSYILPSGRLAPGTALSTQGKGWASNNNANATDPIVNHRDPLLGAGSVFVTGNQVLVVNAGSNTFSAFNIDPADPARPTFHGAYPSGGEFPVSLAASNDGKYLCVANGGAKNGIACYTSSQNDWTHLPAWDRDFGFDFTTPPRGPGYGSVSQIAFTNDFSSLLVAIKGHNPNDASNPTPGVFSPGAIYRYAITMDGDVPRLAERHQIITATGSPFSLTEDFRVDNVIFSADVAAGFEVFTTEGAGRQGAIPNSQAPCWSAQSARTGKFFIIDAGGLNNVTTVEVNPTLLEGTISSSFSVGTGQTSTDSEIFTYEKDNLTGEWLYINTAGTMSITVLPVGLDGSVSLLQRYGPADMPQGRVATLGQTGMAVYKKPQSD